MTTQLIKATKIRGDINPIRTTDNVEHISEVIRSITNSRYNDKTLIKLDVDYYEDLFQDVWVNILELNLYDDDIVRQIANETKIKTGKQILNERRKFINLEYVLKDSED